ncbi:asparagine synthase C-terminal domain-containing protein [Halobellus rarus]|uniref:Asparagine synthase-related protein n=1 Tax=Halobellus rarus TaxID=1126237 RepID=A0ABD6CHF6_9EURY|nr:asparagine synthase C-terminal domain-containing protein [Halobellus rarus]
MAEVEYALNSDWHTEKGWHVRSDQAADPTLNTNANKLSQNNGFYALARVTDDEVILIVDHVRSIPIFYSKIGDDFIFSDSIKWIENKVGTFRDQIYNIEFRTTGYVVDNDTRNPKIKQLLPGSICRYDRKNKKLSTNSHFDFKYINESGNNNLRQVTQTAIQRLTDYADGRQIVLPLSAGIDSRLIATELKDSAYKNVLCFTYGRRNSKEVQLAKKTANSLDLEWIHIPYTEELWRRWYNSDRREQLYEHSDTLVSIPHIEAGPALWYLEEKNQITSDSVFTPGYGGDTISGASLPKTIHQKKQVCLEDVINLVMDEHYTLSSMSDDVKERVRSRIRRTIDSPDIETRNSALEAYERWGFNNRQSKFIINSVRLWDTFNYDWYLPLWDRELVQFWLSVPVRERINRKLYNDYVSRRCSEVGTFKPGTEVRTERSTISEKIKTNLRGTSVGNAMKPFYYRYKREKMYKNHPLAWYGLVDKTEYNQHSTGIGNINTFIAKDILGEIDLNP